MSALSDRLPFDPEEADSGDGWPALRRPGMPSPSATLQLVAFWTAVVLPFLYVPLLASGVATTGERSAFVLLLGLNVVSLYLGHDHNAPG